MVDTAGSLAARLVLDAPDLGRAAEAGSARGYWGRTSNDACRSLQDYVRDTTGMNVSFIDGTSPEAWASTQLVAAGLQRSIALVNRLLWNTTPPDAPRVLDDFSSWLLRQGGDDLEVRLLARLAEKIRTALVFGDEPGEDEIDDLVSLRIVREPTPDVSQGVFDVFISYKHRSYREPAEQLARALAERGLACWLDSHQLELEPGRRVDDRILKRRLREALEASHHTVFFETVAEMTVDENVRGEHVAFNWQIYEHRYANDLIYVRPGSSTVEFSNVGTTATWQTLGELATIVGERCAPANRPGGASAPTRRPSREPDLRDAVRGLQAAADAYFGCPVAISPLATLALLAPERVDDANRPVLGDDVLVNLFRYDAALGLLSTEAGLDVYALLACGCHVNEARWTPPPPRLMEDVLGWGPRALRDEIAGRGTLGTADVFRAIVEYGTEGGSGGKLLERTLRFLGADEADLAATSDRVCTDLLARVERHRSLLGRHGWLFVLDGRWRAYPVALCGTYRVDAWTRPAVVLCEQSRRLFRSDAVADLEGALNDERPDALDHVLDQREELRLTFTGSLTRSTAMEVLSRGAGAAVFAYDVPGATDGDVAPSAEAHAFLHAGRHPRGSAEPPYDGPLGPIARRPAVLLSDGLPRVDRPDPTTFLRLSLDVLAPLSRYAEVRELEYDDLEL